MQNDHFNSQPFTHCEFLERPSSPEQLYWTQNEWSCSGPFAEIYDQNAPVLPERTKTRCETHRESLLAITEYGPRGPRPPVGQYIPMCDESGAYEPIQCHGSTGYCWCVDRNGQEISGTRSEPGSTPMCKETTGF